MEYLTSTTSTTTTTTTTSTTTTPPKRGRREVPDNMRDYFYDNSGLKSWRDDKKVFIGARGYWKQYENTDHMSTQVSVITVVFMQNKQSHPKLCQVNVWTTLGVPG